MDEYQIETGDGQIIVVKWDGATPTWGGGSGEYTADDLRDIAAALDSFDPLDTNEED